MNELDRTRLLEALDLAQQAIGVSDPNPRVGCVIGLADGTVLGSGWTQQAGGPHAEVMALREARALGRDTHGATAWVTLEPCAHHGRTPPCCDALIEAGIARVVIAVGDPYREVDGAGIARLVAAGAAVDMADADIADAARELNIGFFSRVLRRRPWVRMKIAASLDGRTALLNGVSQWITGPDARTDGHVWRRRASAVLTGIGTILKDDPRLDVRLVPTFLQPLRVVVDSSLQLPLNARLLDPPGKVLVATTQESNQAQARALRDRGAELAVLPSQGAKVDLRALLFDLARRGINELHVEAGPKLNGSLVREGLVDELLIYLAPTLLGVGREMASFGPLVDLEQGLRFSFHDTARVGSDLRISARLRRWEDGLGSLASADQGQPRGRR